MTIGGSVRSGTAFEASVQNAAIPSESVPLSPRAGRG